MSLANPAHSLEPSNESVYLEPAGYFVCNCCKVIPAACIGTIYADTILHNNINTSNKEILFFLITKTPKPFQCIDKQKFQNKLLLRNMIIYTHHSLTICMVF